MTFIGKKRGQDASRGVRKPGQLSLSSPVPHGDAHSVGQAGTDTEAVQVSKHSRMHALMENAVGREKDRYRLSLLSTFRQAKMEKDLRKRSLHIKLLCLGRVGW